MCSSSLAITWARPVWCWTRLRGNLSKGRRSRRTGGAESDYRPERWAGFREDYRFTGKEEDVEVGLQYFGKRFLNPLLGRWVSADPLAVHVPGEADWNLYAYVGGTVLKSVDPFGLDVTLIVAAQKTGARRRGDTPAIVQHRVGDDRTFAKLAREMRDRLVDRGWKLVGAPTVNTGQWLLARMMQATEHGP